MQAPIQQVVFAPVFRYRHYYLVACHMQDNNKNRWIDVSAIITDGMVHWPGDIEVQVNKLETIGADGNEANVTALSMSVHVGTHMDAPLHFIENGDDISKIPLDALTGKAKVFSISNPDCITYQDIKELPMEAGDKILFRTRNSETDWERKPFMTDYVYLEQDAAEYLAEKSIMTVGIDYLSVGGGETGSEVHRILLGQPVYIIEGLKLRNIADGEYEMICLPLNIKGSDGAPARVLLRPWQF